jgi:hypothetical protein
MAMLLACWVLELMLMQIFHLCITICLLPQLRTAPSCWPSSGYLTMIAGMHCIAVASFYVLLGVLFFVYFMRLHCGLKFKSGTS